MASPSRFDRSALPPAEVFYRANVAKFRARGRRATGLCPFHKDRNPSLSIDLDRGLFYCFTCAIGGGIVDFVMQRDGVDFKAAAKALGAWRGERINEIERVRMDSRRREREARSIQVGSLSAIIRDLRMHYRNEIHILGKIERDTSEHINEPGISPEELETCWAVLAENLPQLREAVAAYYLLSFATVGERIDFALHPDQRAAAIQAVMNRGTVRDDSGVVTEVDFPCGHKSDDVCGVELTFP